jgi:hypothetical protein
MFCLQNRTRSARRCWANCSRQLMRANSQGLLLLTRPGGRGGGTRRGGTVSGGALVRKLWCWWSGVIGCITAGSCTLLPLPTPPPPPHPLPPPPPPLAALTCPQAQLRRMRCLAGGGGSRLAKGVVVTYGGAVQFLLTCFTCC